VANNPIIKIESGKNTNQTINTLERVAKALGVSIEKLFKE
jgi:transcriptional regulator with XRE-family HTH domain